MPVIRRVPPMAASGATGVVCNPPTFTSFDPYTSVGGKTVGDGQTFSGSTGFADAWAQALIDGGNQTIECYSGTGGEYTNQGLLDQTIAGGSITVLQIDRTGVVFTDTRFRTSLSQNNTYGLTLRGIGDMTCPAAADLVSTGSFGTGTAQILFERCLFKSASTNSRCFLCSTGFGSGSTMVSESCIHQSQSGMTGRWFWTQSAHNITVFNGYFNQQNSSVVMGLNASIGDFLHCFSCVTNDGLGGNLGFETTTNRYFGDNCASTQATLSGNFFNSLTSIDPSVEFSDESIGHLAAGSQLLGAGDFSNPPAVGKDFYGNTLTAANIPMGALVSCTP